MKASIIIPTYNKLPLLQQTLAALARQDIPHNSFEVIVTDDASTDGTKDFLQEASYTFTLHPIFHTQNKGRAQARNNALRIAKGDIIIFIDDDMVTVPEFMSAHLALHKPKQRLVGLGNTTTSTAGRTAFTDYLDHTGVHRLPAGADIPFKYFTSNNASVPRHLLYEIGFFDVAFNTYGGEDTELGFRLQHHAKCAFMYAEEAQATHIHYRTLTEACAQMRTYGSTGLTLLYRTNQKCAEGLNLYVIDTPKPYTESRKKTLKKVLFRILYHAPMYWIVRFCVVLPLGKIRMRGFDFLMSYSYLKGLQKGLKNSSTTSSTT